MIIGNNYKPNPNQNFENSNFNKKNQTDFTNKNKTAEENFNNNLLTKDLSTFKYTDPANTNQMYDKSLAMLHERLKNKTITPEEFNRKCQDLAKKRMQ